MILPTFKSILRLVRFEYLGFSGVCVIGALCAIGPQLTLKDTFVLFIIHLLSIAWGFVHNDICDTHYDKYAIHLKERPLLSGDISVTFAWYLTIACIAAAFAMAAIFYTHWLVLLVYLLSIPFAVLYNRYGKFIIGADIFFASSAALLCLFGSFAVLGEIKFSTDIPNLVWIMVAIQFFDHIFFNIAGSLKDVAVDREAGARTTPIVCGVETHQDGTITIPMGFKILLMALKVVTIALVFLPFFLGNFPSHPFQLAAISVMAFLAIYHTWKIANLSTFDRKQLASLIIRQENFCKGLIPLLLVSYIGLGWMIFFMIPALWFMIFNKYISGKVFEAPKTF